MESYYLQQILQVLNNMYTLMVTYLPFIRYAVLAIVFGVFIYIGFNSISKRWLRF